MLIQRTLELTATLCEVPAWDIHLDLACPGESLIELFEQETLLPGVIMTHNHQVKGMISRRRFLEKMSRPYSQEIFPKRPVAVLYSFLEVESLILPEETSIIEATQVALQRPIEFAYEPFLVKSRSGTYRLLDFHQLLLVYSQIPNLALRHLQKTEQEARVAETKLLKLQKDYAYYLQTEKMAALGQLVAGVAHEINNPINFIDGNLKYLEDYSQEILNLLQLYQKYYPDPNVEIQAQTEEINLDFLQADMPKMLQSLRVGTDRICQIVLSLRNFSRMDEAEAKVVDIHEGIDSTLMILQHRLKIKRGRPAIEVIKDYGQLPLVECYPGQLNQVFMNILANAIDALEDVNINRAAGNPNQPLGEITIRTSVKDAQWVQIAIADNGPGIPTAIQSRIFDPFFTTKPVGKGTGMGMSISYQIVNEKHRGKLNCRSTVGEGTEFVIELPIQL